MKRQTLAEALGQLSDRVASIGRAAAADDPARIREHAKAAARIAAHVAALARSRERSRCKHDFPEAATLEKSGWFNCSRCKLARHIQSTNPNSRDRILCDQCTCYHARQDACPI